MVIIDDSADLLRLLENDADFRRDVRRWILTEELLAVPARIDALESQQTRMGDLLVKVVEMQSAMRDRMDAFEKRMDEFSERMDAFSERMDGFALEMLTMNRRLGTLEDRVGTLWGRDLEERLAMEFDGIYYREFGLIRTDLAWSAFGGSGNFPQGGAVAFRDRMRGAVDDGVIDYDEFIRLTSADAIGRGFVRATYQGVWLVTEASGAIGLEYVTRTRDRADILGRVETDEVRAFVYGYRIGDSVRAAAEKFGVAVALREGSNAG